MPVDSGQPPLGVFFAITVVNANNYSLILHELKVLISMGIRNVALNPYISAGRGSIANLGVTNEQMFNLFKDLSDMILSLYYKDNIIFIEKNLFHIVKRLLQVVIHTCV